MRAHGKIKIDMEFLILIIIIAIVVYFVSKKKSTANVSALSVAEMNMTDNVKFSNGVLVPQEVAIGNNRNQKFMELIADDTTGKLQSVVTKLLNAFSPNKNGEFNDAKACGLALAETDATVSKILGKRSDNYVVFFAVSYDRILSSMLGSDNATLIEYARYTLDQVEEYYATGKCQTFVKGLHPDGLVARAEILMAIIEKCWFGNKKTTMFRKDMEKHTLPSSTQEL